MDAARAIDVLGPGAADADHLRHASREGRLVLTQDDDFLRLAAAGHKHAGIIFAPQGTSIGKVVRGVMLIHDLVNADEMHDHVEFL